MCRWIFCQKILFFPHWAKKLWKSSPLFFTFMSAKVSKFVLYFGKKLLRFTLFWEQFDKICTFWAKSIKIWVKVSPDSYFPPPPTNIWQNIHLWWISKCEKVTKEHCFNIYLKANHKEIFKRVELLDYKIRLQIQM